MAETRRYPAAVAVLIACQALAMTCSALVITTTALVGRMLAPDPGLATLPLAAQFGALMVTTRGAAWLMARAGRRVGFSAGAGAGVVGGAIAATAIIAQHFGLFVLGALGIGAFLAHAMQYRFAAADTVPPARQSRVISWVMAGGILAAVAGPQLANWSRALFAPFDFAGVYAVLAGLCLLQLGVLQLAHLPDPGAQASHAPDGPARHAQSGRRPTGFAPAVVCGMIAYGGMNLVMAVTPPAMADSGLDFPAAAFVIQWHVLAMYAPAFVTGTLITRLGLQPVLLLGVALMAAAVAINVAGVTLAHFAVGLVMLGVGWNFLFVGATTWVTRIQTAATTARLQGVNDMFVFGTVAVTAMSSGWLLETVGWAGLNLIVLPVLALAVGVVLWNQPAVGPTMADSR